MSKNENLLDKIDVPSPREKSYYINRTIIYCVCMLGGSLIYTAFITPLGVNIIVDSLLQSIVVFFVAIPIELFRKFRRKSKRKATNEVDDPVWFHILESAFSLLILFWFISMVSLLIFD